MDNVLVIRSGYDAFAQGDMPALAEVFDPAIEWHVSDTTGFDSTYRGADAVFGFFGSLQDLWAELHVEPEEIVVIDEDRVLVLGHHRGRVLDGDSVDIPFAHLWTLRSGRAVRFFEYADTGLVLIAQGAVGQPATA